MGGLRQPPPPPAVPAPEDDAIQERLSRLEAGQATILSAVGTLRAEIHRQVESTTPVGAAAGTSNDISRAIRALGQWADD